MAAEFQKAIAELLAAIAALKARVAEAAEANERIQRAIDEHDTCRWRLTQKIPEAEKVKTEKRVKDLTHEIEKACAAGRRGEIKVAVQSLAARVESFLDTMPRSYRRSQQIRSDIKTRSLFSPSLSHQRLASPLKMAGALHELAYLERRLVELSAVLPADEQEAIPSASEPKPKPALAGQSISAQFRAARLSVGHTQEKAAEIIGCAVSTVSRYEAGALRKPRKHKEKLEKYIQDPRQARRS